MVVQSIIFPEFLPKLLSDETFKISACQLSFSFVVSGVGIERTSIASNRYRQGYERWALLSSDKINKLDLSLELIF